jgi:putative transposase
MDDKVNRLFKADRPNKLCPLGVCFAKACRAMDALEQAIWQRKTPDNKDLVHHSDRGSQYLSIKYTERLAEPEIDLSVGTVGDAYDNALAECVIGLFKTEVINQIGPWKSMREVEWETLKWPYGDEGIAYRLTGRLV